MNGPVRETTLEERLTWGDCPICHAAHGAYCDPTGITLGVHADGSELKKGEGAHLSRLWQAPRKVRLVEVRE